MLTLIVDSCISSQAVTAPYAQLAEHIEIGLSMLPESLHAILPPTSSIGLQNTYIKDKFLASTIVYSHGTPKAVQEGLF